MKYIILMVITAILIFPSHAENIQDKIDTLERVHKLKQEYDTINNYIDILESVYPSDIIMVQVTDLDTYGITPKYSFYKEYAKDIVGLSIEYFKTKAAEKIEVLEEEVSWIYTLADSMTVYDLDKYQ